MSSRPVYAVVQARLGSSRLPGKSLFRVGDLSLLELVLFRVLRSKSLSGTIAALPDTAENDILATMAAGCGVEVVRGDHEDVLSRFVLAVHGKTPCSIVRVCADNPLIAPEAIDALCAFFDPALYDIGQNISRSTGYPDGVGAEILASECLERINVAARDKISREHVTLFAYDHPKEFRIAEVKAEPAWNAPDVRLDIDYGADYEAMVEFIKLLPSGPLEATLDDIVRVAVQNKKILEKRFSRS
jgi:spore coat polysaccharide biosynthesis protein SpsF